MNFSPINPIASIGRQAIVIILRYNRRLFILDQVLSRKNTEFILVLYHVSLQGVIWQNMKLQCGKFAGLFTEK